MNLLISHEFFLLHINMKTILLINLFYMKTILLINLFYISKYYLVVAYFT